MRRESFVDTWFFIALLDPRDTHHRNALRLSAAMDSSLLVTHEGVLTEALAYFAETRARTAALLVVRQSLQKMQVIPASRLFERALDLYESRPDKEYSLVDCMSMVVMRDRGIAHVLTNDHHFRQEGFTVVSE